MVITIKKDAPAGAIEEALKVLSRQPKHPKKGVDTKKYVGKIKFPVDGLTYQKKIRAEW